MCTLHQILSGLSNQEMGRACSTYGERRGAHRVLVEKQAQRPLGRPRRRLEDNIKIVLREVVWRASTGMIWLRTGTGGGFL